ncbi:MAG: hypothetical protein EHM93_10210 [Bacteroidales bacterium]|nr:MAG: hypothetical protein EHM93_10210 [Bacteroidales bacterium]
MKKLALITFALFAFKIGIYAQSNVYPTSGDVKIYGYSPALILQRNTSEGGFVQGIQTKLFDGTNSWFFGTLHGDEFRVSKGDYQDAKLIVNSSGNVGIGTTAPSARLHVANAYDFNGNMIAAILGNGYNHWTNFGGLTAGRIRGSNEGYLVLESNPNGSGDKNLYLNHSSSGNVLMANGGGNVGIGTATPVAKLDVNGSVVFAGSSFTSNATDWGIYQTNANAKNYFNGNVGIGTTTPAASLDVVRRSLGQLAKFSEHSDLVAANGESYISVGYSPINLGYHYVAGDSYGFIEMNGGSRAIVIKKNGNVGIGTTNPLYKLAVEGTIAAREVKVTAESWADFVFRPTYKLRTLGEVEQFIKTNSHLPEIPSAAEVKENGVSLGEMNAKLLQKVEELTLYMIELQKQVDELKAQQNTIKK